MAIFPLRRNVCCIMQVLFLLRAAGIMGEVELSCRAYVKMYLHCCLFPRCSVNGLLLSSSSSTGGAVCVTDAVPLLHSHLPLAPITQLALTQVGREGGRCQITVQGKIVKHTEGDDVIIACSPAAVWRQTATGCVVTGCSLAVLKRCLLPGLSTSYSSLSSS